MILTCPDCATNYSTADEAIGPNGRTVRCSKCDATWFIEGEPINVPDEIALRDLEEAEDFAIGEEDLSSRVPQDYAPPKDASYSAEPGAHVLLRKRQEREQRGRKLVWVRAIWAAALLALLAAFGYGVTQRHNIVKKYPRTATIYKTLGLDMTRSGFSFEDIKTRNTLIDGQSVYVVNGTVRNLQNTASAVPLVEFSFLDVAGEPIATWLVDVEADTLDGGEAADFNANYPNPPLDAVSLRYRFVQDKISP